MNDDELRKAWQARHPGTSAEPSPEELQRLVAREGTDDERLEILDRALSSSRGSRELELLRAISQAGRLDQPRRWWRGTVPLALAASVLLVTVGVLLRRDVAREETRATPADGSPVLVAPATDAQVTDPVTFVWQAVPGARSYRVELLSDAGTLVTSIETPDTTARSALAGVARPDSSYRWVVVALLPEGVEVASRPRRVTLKEP